MSKYYCWGLNTVLHTQWQFFYDKKWAYDQDNRFVGEHPAPYDNRVFKKFSTVLGIDIIQHNDDIDDGLIFKIEKDIEEFGVSLFLANKFFFDKVQGKKYPFALLTTVLITDIDYTNKKVKFIIGDDNLSYSDWISIESFLKSLKYAPHERVENGSRFTFKRSMETGSITEIEGLVEKYAPVYIFQSAKEFLKGSKKSNSIHGAIAMELFAKDIVTWPHNKVIFNEIRESKRTFEKLIDSAKFILFAKRQREFFIKALLELDNTIYNKYLPIYNWVASIEKIIKRWESLRYLFFLSGSRRQIGAISKIAMEIDEIRKLEIELQTDLTRRLRYYCINKKE